MAAVTIVAVDSILPMDVFGKWLRGNMETLGIALPQLRCTVASRARVPFKW
jgi:hypothetical protein